MTEVELKYLHHFVDRHGHERWYFRRHGKRTALPGGPGSAEFQEAYLAAVNEMPAARRPRVVAVRGRSFRDLSTRYFASANYLNLSRSSRINYKRVIDGFCEEHGHRLVAECRREHIDKIIGKMVAKPGAAIVLLKRIRTLVKYAVALGWIEHDPTLGARSFRSREIHTWTEAELEKYEARWLVGSKQRLAYALLLYTAQRGSDVRRMVWPDIAGDCIRVAQQKVAHEERDESLVIPLHLELRKVLAVAERTDVAILVTEFGRPFSSKGFGNFVSAAIQAAELPSNCKAHGLRKAAARRLAEAGCTEKQIMAITGHKTLAEVGRYTRAADQRQLARQAMEKQGGNVEVATPKLRVATLD